MIAILELIKTLIPFGIAFLILWGIGRLCCTKSSNQSTEDQAKKKKNPRQKKKATNNPQQGFKKESMMDNKSDFFPSKQPLISRLDVEDHELNQIIPLPASRQKKLKPLQKAFLLKEILDSPKAVKPYKRKYPR